MALTLHKKHLNTILYIPVYGLRMSIYGNNMSQYGKIQDSIQALFALCKAQTLLLKLLPLESYSCYNYQTRGVKHF